MPRRKRDDGKSRSEILARMVKIAQTLSIWQSKVGLAVGRRNEEETDLRMRHLRRHQDGLLCQPDEPNRRQPMVWLMRESCIPLRDSLQPASSRKTKVAARVRSVGVGCPGAGLRCITVARTPIQRTRRVSLSPMTSTATPVSAATEQQHYHNDNQD
jgi:hypothetical protein